MERLLIESAMGFRLTFPWTMPALAYADDIVLLAENEAQLQSLVTTRIAAEAIQEELGWLAFEACNAQSKITYEARLHTMDDTRWSRKLPECINIAGIRTQLRTRVHTLRRKYGFLTCTDDEATERRSAMWTLYVTRALSRLRKHTATGPEGIPARLIKCRGPDSKEQLAGFFTMLEGEVPKEWRLGRVVLIPKKGGKVGHLNDYRPLTVTCTL
ncbi:hypothetical protein HPB50_015427 [Hyalomma asiaticum]|uniref:Uncharacterized protein n=1 Tax=Hyalomma asiaticum TaxID=266040 RepID=A0ACB7SHT9_HYAAI|nr:hypothetical protein HPB50_015427 [Hyalomma asiaticum]